MIHWAAEQFEMFVLLKFLPFRCSHVNPAEVRQFAGTDVTKCGSHSGHALCAHAGGGHVRVNECRHHDRNLQIGHMPYYYICTGK